MAADDHLHSIADGIREPRRVANDDPHRLGFGARSSAKSWLPTLPVGVVTTIMRSPGESGSVCVDSFVVWTRLVWVEEGHPPSSRVQWRAWLSREMVGERRIDVVTRFVAREHRLIGVRSFHVTMCRVHDTYLS